LDQVVRRKFAEFCEGCGRSLAEMLAEALGDCGCIEAAPATILEESLNLRL
jgi:hypothetical protein